MNLNWMDGFNQMMQEMERCGQSATSQLSEIECRFNICLKYWAGINHHLEDLRFETMGEKIEFYKTVIPLFKSQMEYHNLIYQSEILQPEDMQELKEFWIREQQRLDKFLLQYRDFYNYYKSDATNLDEKYFLVTGQQDENGNPFSYNELIAMLMALEKYHQYAESKLSKLSTI